jgi:toxin ParE1/3/4
MKVRLTRRAMAQLQSALEFIAGESPSGAAKVRARIEHALDLLADFPYLGRPGAETETREFAIPQTPYVLIYRVGAEVDIVAVLHGRQERPV